MAPERVVGRELSHADAVKDLILLVWKRELKRLRDEARQRAEETGERPDREAWRQLGRDMDLLQTWKEGSVVIQMHLAERRKT
jgi:hypothetical protein